MDAEELDEVRQVDEPGQVDELAQVDEPGQVDELAQVDEVGQVDEVAAVTKALHARGERMTGPRRAVIRALAAERGHLPAEGVVRAVADLDPAVHRASVYRTLEALSQLGVVQHVHVGHGGTAYHLLRRERPHLHASCRECGTVRDLPADLLDEVAGRVVAEHDFHLDATHVALSGTCGECRRAGADGGHGPHG